MAKQTQNAAPKPTVKPKTVKMKFSKNMYYRDPNVPLYVAGKIYEVEESMVARWVKRGGDIVGEETKSFQTNPPPVEPTPETPVDQTPENGQPAKDDKKSK